MTEWINFVSNIVAMSVVIALLVIIWRGLRGVSREHHELKQAIVGQMEHVLETDIAKSYADLNREHERLRAEYGALRAALDSDPRSLPAGLRVIHD